MIFCSYCDLQYISATTFHQLCKLFPEFTQRFINELSSDYSCNLWELHKPVDERENLNNFKRKNGQIPSVTGTQVNREYVMIFFSIWSSRQERNGFKFLRRWHFEGFTRWKWSRNHAAAGRVVRLESRNRNTKVRRRLVFLICARYQLGRAIEVVQRPSFSWKKIVKESNLVWWLFEEIEVKSELFLVFNFGKK